MEFLRIYQIFPKRFEPLENSSKNSKWGCSQFYNLNSVENWKWTQWEKLFRRINSSTMPSFNNFWTSGWSSLCILKSVQSLNNCKTTLCTELGPAQCYSTGRSNRSRSVCIRTVSRSQPPSCRPRRPLPAASRLPRATHATTTCAQCL
jgi:hypothetical protein